VRVTGPAGYDDIGNFPASHFIRHLSVSDEYEKMERLMNSKWVRWSWLGKFFIREGAEAPDFNMTVAEFGSGMRNYFKRHYPGQISR
jgi:hypothetical protein